MPSVDLVVESPIVQSARVKQLGAMFDVPIPETSKLEWHGEFDVDAEPWSVGLIVGPSGSGKTLVATDLFGKPRSLRWSTKKAVIDDFAARLSMEDISRVCGAVGFNTIPAWMRPYSVLSTGEKFRVSVARSMIEAPTGKPIVVDEFTSVVDRQVAKIASHAIQKHVRRNDLQFVAVSCHYDVIDWLQPDWILEPESMTLARRHLQQRPDIDASIRHYDRAVWRRFAPFHYLTRRLHKSASCYCLVVDDQPVAVAAMLPFPHPKARGIVRCSRLVTLPDWQGVGCAMTLIHKMGAVYKDVGKRLRTYPAHPALIRAFDRSREFAMKSRPASFGPATGLSSKMTDERGENQWHQGSRPCAVFEYCGPPLGDADLSKEMLRGKKF